MVFFLFFFNDRHNYIITKAKVILNEVQHTGKESTAKCWERMKGRNLLHTSFLSSICTSTDKGFSRLHGFYVTKLTVTSWNGSITTSLQHREGIGRSCDLASLQFRSAINFYLTVYRHLSSKKPQGWTSSKQNNARRGEPVNITDSSHRRKASWAFYVEKLSPSTQSQSEIFSCLCLLPPSQSLSLLSFLCQCPLQPLHPLRHSFLPAFSVRGRESPLPPSGSLFLC